MQVLERDRHKCQIQIPGICTDHANTVDHIRPLVEGGASLDMGNLRASCAPCNRYLGAKLGGKRLQMQRLQHSRAW